MAAAAAPAPSSSEIAAEGPVLNLINKRLRALRKKLNRIAQMEDAVVQGKTLNKEQEETLRSKPSVLAGIDELEKIRQPLLSAVDQEIELALAKNKQNNDISTTEIANEGDASKPEAKAANGDASAVSDLLNLLYFGSVFDVKTLMRANDNMLTRTHERNCCLTYDYVTDDDAAGDPLKEWDLDLIAMLGGLLISRPVSSSLSHKDSLENCVEHAKLWLANADQPIEPNSDITYSGLREKLNKIMASDYFTTTPEIRAPVEVAAAAGNYTSFQVPVHGSMIPPVSMPVPVEGSGAEFQHEEEQSPNSHGNEIYGDESGSAEELHQGGSEVENPSEDQAQTEHVIPDAEADQNLRDADLKEQHGAPRKPYQNYRGGRGGGGRRGYSNGHGGRGGSRGGYQNSRGQFYDQPGGYHQRNNNNFRGRGGRGMGGNFNYHGPSGNDGHAQTAS
ncbi:glycine-rich protein [Perilla frutescens var. hirtella]|uniref:Glycine-rich protein n=1 Tax=Perilla frutescens var. hirtella TaxID=608512 RepID=A0AAD4P0S0_PERFH|nr:glycine-rich protein [Perilla frutescens var. hirtella]KAH6805268.1 glycine-rich protein [Perilla frutescens var. frutescens]KAH6822354.1 glycine-rich protein [Perilla frutescens var. hirtella]